MKTLKIFGLLFFIITLIILSIPQTTYIYYLNKIEKPIPPATITISEEDALNLWEKYEKNREIKLEELGPYDIIYSFVKVIFLEAENKNKAFPSGSRIISIVVRNSLNDYLIKESILTTGLSEYALSIWISRNWTEKQILEKLLEIENRKINREYNLNKILEFFSSKKIPDHCVYCFNEEHKLLYDFIKSYKTKNLSGIIKANQALSDHKIILNLSEEISKSKREQATTFVKNNSSFFELYLKTILKYSEKDINGINNFTLLFSAADGWFAEDLENRLYLFIKSNTENFVQDINKIEDSINIMHFETTPFSEDRELQNKLLKFCKKHKNCDTVRKLINRI